MNKIIIPDSATFLLNQLENAGYESYVVGGCVRDSLLGNTPNDWDICTAALPEQVMEIFSQEKIIPTGLQHGTVTVVINGEAFEITTFRKETDYTDHRHPDQVKFVSKLQEDAARRDFTMNAMAYSPSRGLMDCFQGQEDIAQKVLRCVGNPMERFEEDALRILRALRFASRFEYSIEEQTSQAMFAKKGLLQNISKERIFSELKGILLGSGVEKILFDYSEILFEILPELRPMQGFDQCRPSRHQWDVWGHTVHAVAAAEKDIYVRLAMLFHDCGKPETFSQDPETGYGRFYGHPEAGAQLADKLLSNLKVDNETRQIVVALVRNHEMRAGHSRKALRRRLSKIGEENMRRLMLVRRADALAHTPETCKELLIMANEDEAILGQLLQEEGRLQIKDLKISGQDLMTLGYQPGKALGEQLENLLNLVLDEVIPNEHTALMGAAEKGKPNA